MATRVVNGNTFTEDGWPLVDQAGCNWITVPGTSVSLQIQQGQPTALLRAWAADWNAFVEPLRDADSACWTEGNSVLGQPGRNNGSNHLGGTAIDLNWNSHPMGPHAPDDPRAGFTPAQVATINEMKAFYTYKGVQMVWWANDWDTPHDSMHSQCGYNTYNNPATAEFIARFIRADGFSTFRRGNAPVVSVKDQHALGIIHEGQRRGISERGIKIALATALVESNITIYANERVPASMSIPHEAVGSDAYSVGIFQQQVRDTGNGWWWGDAATCMDPTLSAGLFYDRLARLDYNGPNSPGSYAQAVQASAFPDRYDQRFAEAEQLYNRLINLGDIEDDMANVPQDEWDWVYNELHKAFASRSMYADAPDEDTFAGRAVSAHAFGWDQRVEGSALNGEGWAIDLVARAAAGTLWGVNQAGSPDQFLVNHALAFLAQIEAVNPAALKNYLAKKGVAA